MANLKQSTNLWSVIMVKFCQCIYAKPIFIPDLPH